MANGHVEIHNPFSERSDLAASSNRAPESASDLDSMADTVEFRLVTAYVNRRRKKRDIEFAARNIPTARNTCRNSEGRSSPEIPTTTKKEEKGRKSRRKTLARVGGHREEEEIQSEAAGLPEERTVKEDDELEDAAGRLTEIADEIPFTPPEIQFDSEEDAVEKVIGLLLREAGDRLNQQGLINAGIAMELFWNYSFFETLMRTFLIRMGLMTSDPDALGPQASPKTQIAMTCEVTSRLSAVDTLPMSRMLDHGARYLKVHLSSWAQQHGGYGAAFYSDEEEEEEEEEQ